MGINYFEVIVLVQRGIPIKKATCRNCIGTAWSARKNINEMTLLRSSGPPLAPAFELSGRQN